MITPDQQSKMRHARQKAPGLGAMTIRRLQAATSRLTPSQEALIGDRLSEMPKTSITTYLRALSGKSPRAAIKAMCMECVQWVRKDVAECGSPACPLYPYRPFQERHP